MIIRRSLICQKCQKEKKISEFVKDKSKKIGYRNICKDCRKIYLDEWNLNNKESRKISVNKYNKSEKRKLNSKRFYEKNKESISIKQKIDRIKNPEKYYKWYRKYYDLHKEEIYNYIEKNREKYKGFISRWKKSEKGKISGRLSCARRRARILETQIKQITKEDILMLLIKQDWKCAISGEDLHNGFHIDHKIPLSKGGGHVIENIQLLSPKENLKKGAKCS